MNFLDKLSIRFAKFNDCNWSICAHLFFGCLVGLFIIYMEEEVAIKIFTYFSILYLIAGFLGLFLINKYYKKNLNLAKKLENLVK